MTLQDIFTELETLVVRAGEIGQKMALGQEIRLDRTAIKQRLKQARKTIKQLAMDVADNCSTADAMKIMFLSSRVVKVYRLRIKAAFLHQAQMNNLQELGGLLRSCTSIQ